MRSSRLQADTVSIRTQLIMWYWMIWLIAYVGEHTAVAGGLVHILNRVPQESLCIRVDSLKEDGIDSTDGRNFFLCQSLYDRQGCVQERRQGSRVADELSANWFRRRERSATARQSCWMIAEGEEYPLCD